MQHVLLQCHKGIMFKNSLLVTCLLVGFSSTSNANESTGFLKDIFVNKDGLVLFRLSNPVNQRPKCANNSDWDYKFDIAKPGAAAMFDLLKMAELTSKPVRVGYGAEPSCGKGFPAIETDYILFNNLRTSNKAGKGNYVKGK